MELDLEKDLRPKLERMEDSIILSLFERSQYKLNDKIYARGAIKEKTSFLDFLLWGTEQVHASAGRYDNPEEHAFFDNPPPTAIDRDFEWPVDKTEINVNPKIKKMYLNNLGRLCTKGNDKNEYGSTAICDINCLQNISRRVHFGIFVAESKFQQEPEDYIEMIKAADIEKIKFRLKNGNVEADILSRVKEKSIRYNLPSMFIETFYKQEIIPLTIDVEIEYLMKKQALLK
jgi:chorismate mutase